MPATLIQSKLGGSASANLTGAHQTLITTPAGFANPTVAGNSLVLVMWATTSGASCGEPLETGPPTTPGLTWNILGNRGRFFISSPRAIGVVHAWFKHNAPSIPPTTTTTVQIESGTASGTNPYKVEFCLFEFSGLDPAGFFDVVLSPFDQTGGTPGQTITTTATDLVMAIFIADPATGAAIPAGAGFTLGPSSVVATFGQTQFRTNVPAGAVADFFGGTEPFWGAEAFGFRQLAAPPPPPPPPSDLPAPTRLSRPGTAPVTGQVIPLDAAPNQTFKFTVTVGGKLLQLGAVLRYNEEANYWSMALLDASGSLLLDSIPLLTGDFPAANILAQYKYLGIGSAYVVNASQVKSPNFPDNRDLGTDFLLVWGDNPA